MNVVSVQSPFSTDRPAAEKYFGKYPGRVLKNAAPESQPHRGELLVEVSGILEEAPGGGGQRPLQAVAKPCFAPGFFFIPEEGASVWVEFVAGDINSPVWTGVWYPKDATPQTANAKAPTESQKVIRTASGHVMELDDDGAKIVLIDKHQNTITLNDNGITITDKSSNQVVMNAEGVKVVDAHNNEIILAAGGVTVKSQAIKLGSDAAAEPLVLGNQFLTLFNTHMHIGNLGAPTSPPVAAGTPFTVAHLSARHKTE